jgi:WhiB family transcriptional regulator, redox-sensing transcriptional regulator
MSSLSIGAVPRFVLEDRGACGARDVEPQWFEPSFGEPADDWLGIDKARAVCRRCPVLVECRTFALSVKGLDGMWGATTPAERKELRRSA